MGHVSCVGLVVVVLFPQVHRGANDLFAEFLAPGFARGQLFQQSVAQADVGDQHLLQLQLLGKHHVG